MKAGQESFVEKKKGREEREGALPPHTPPAKGSPFANPFSSAPKQDMPHSFFIHGSVDPTHGRSTSCPLFGASHRLRRRTFTSISITKGISFFSMFGLQRVSPLPGVYEGAEPPLDNKDVLSSSQRESVHRLSNFLCIARTCSCSVGLLESAFWT